MKSFALLTFLMLTVSHNAWATESKSCEGEARSHSVLNQYTWQQGKKDLSEKGSTDAAKTFLLEFLNANHTTLVAAINSRQITIGDVDSNGLKMIEGRHKWTRKSKSKPKGDLALKASTIRMFKYEGSDSDINAEIDIADGKDGSIFVADIRIVPATPKRPLFKFGFPKELIDKQVKAPTTTMDFPLTRKPNPEQGQTAHFNTHIPLRIGTVDGISRSFIGHIVQIRATQGDLWMRFTDEQGREGWVGAMKRFGANIMGVAFYDHDHNSAHPIFEEALPWPTTTRTRSAKPKALQKPHGAVKISEEEFRKILAKHAYSKSEIESDDEVERFASAVGMFAPNGDTEDENLIAEFPVALMGDLKQVKIGFDNRAYGAGGDSASKEIRRLVGFQKLSNGLTILGMEVSKDTEVPAYVAFYFDGEHLRAYVPHDGNPFNDEKNQAYGMTLNGKWKTVDVQNAEKRFPEPMRSFVNDGNMGLEEVLKPDADKIEADILRNLPVRN